MIFARKRPEAEKLPTDPNDTMVQELRDSFPYGAAPFGVRSMIQLVVWVVFEMKKRGLV